MRITDLMTEDTILLKMEERTKTEVINRMVEKLDEAGVLYNRQEFLQSVLKREEQSTTGFGNGIAIPHAKSKSVKKVTIAFAKSVEGVHFESLDGKPVNLLFMIAVPENANQTHLDILAKLATVLMKDDARIELLKAESTDKIREILHSFDESEFSGDKEGISEESPYIVAVTGCPTGIAHTYMAAQALEEQAAKLGIGLKVETNGAAGVKNHLTKREIENAASVIIASDTKVNLARFSGKHLIIASVADGMIKPEVLLEKALKQDGPFYDYYDGLETSNGRRRDFYQHLMSGLSNMLPFAVGGGILFSIAYLIGFNENPFAQSLHFIGGQSVFSLLLPILSGYIAKSIADRPGFAPGAVGGLLAAMDGAGLLGGIIAGFLSGWIVNLLKRAVSRISPSFSAMTTILVYPVLGMLLIGMIMLPVNPYIEFFNDRIANTFFGLSPSLEIIIGALLGMLMAIDMGGPINKIVYLIGIGFLVGGIYEPMAAIMAGGMIPPLAVALASTLFKHKFSLAEQKLYRGNYVKGLCFMTEGAVPFVNTYRKRYLLPILIGSGCAGAISMAAGVGLATPHGGIFVVPLVFGQWYLYVLAIIISSLISALLIGVLKKQSA
ncbi:PTS system fructose-specific IIC component [Cytobacillus purgationiresistens]|uniref:PTS system fructose-specific IIC component n=1 Tax=Cytobacillus purgationiresistens TaxID=863449 RepID=A0ABU0AGH9_9BACI|nr:PTS system fructose-specific IIC component [Cytobacillus purgationiresistens]